MLRLCSQYNLNHSQHHILFYALHEKKLPTIALKNAEIKCLYNFENLLHQDKEKKKSCIILTTAFLQKYK